MKYFKKWDSFKLIENLETKILYHGSPYIFDKFKDNDTFFSDIAKFALDYTNQKSMDYAMDADDNLYTVELNCNIFDINNDIDYEKMIKIYMVMNMLFIIRY